MSRNDSSGASPLNADSARGRSEQESDRHSHVGHQTAPSGRELEHEKAREKFGGVNLGASFFGWIVAVGVAVILTSIIGAVGVAVGFTGNVSQSEAERQTGTIGIAAAVVLLVVLMMGYYCGGYVAGRMSRFDGGRQGLAVWLIGLAVTVIAIGLGALFGSQYNVLDRVSLPRVPIALDQLGWGAVVTGVAVIVLTLLAAIIGGKVGHRYHNRVDRATGR